MSLGHRFALGGEPVLQQERVERGQVLDQIEQPQVCAGGVAVGPLVEAGDVEQRGGSVAAVELEAGAAAGDVVDVVGDVDHRGDVALFHPAVAVEGDGKIGRASCRERVCQYV